MKRYRFYFYSEIKIFQYALDIRYILQLAKSNPMLTLFIVGEVTWPEITWPSTC